MAPNFIEDQSPFIEDQSPCLETEETIESPSRRMMSEQIGELAAALAKAQGEIESAVKSQANPFFKSKYADLAEVWKAAREPLSKNTLAVVQLTQGGPETVSIETVLVHSSGQWIRSELTLKPVKADPQGIGSAITYGRRYAMAAIIGITQEDDDANAASGKPGKKAKQDTDLQKSIDEAATEAIKKGAMTEEQVAKAKVKYANDPQKLFNGLLDTLLAHEK